MPQVYSLYFKLCRSLKVLFKKISNIIINNHEVNEAIEVEVRLEVILTDSELSFLRAIRLKCQALMKDLLRKANCRMEAPRGGRLSLFFHSHSAFGENDILKLYDHCINKFRAAEPERRPGESTLIGPGKKRKMKEYTLLKESTRFREVKKFKNEILKTIDKK